MPEPITPHTIRPRGVNTHDNPRELWKVGETPDALNGYFDGVGWMKRPALLKVNAQAGPASGIVYDMVRHAMNSTDTPPERAPDSLFQLVYKSGSETDLVDYDLATMTGQDQGGVFHLTQAGETDIGKFEKLLIPADLDMIHVTTARSVTGAYQHRKIEYVSGAFAGGDNGPAGNLFTEGIWHREHLCLLAAADLIVTNYSDPYHIMIWSDLNDARTYSADSYVILRTLGRMWELHGMNHAGDVVYFTKSDSIFGMTGATESVWRLERIADFGGGRGRSMVDAEGILFGIATEPGKVKDSALGKGGTYPCNIFVARGLEAKLIGQKVASFLRAIVPNGSGEVNDRKSVYWLDKKLVMFFPRIPFGVAVVSESLTYHVLSESWNRWTYGAAQKPNAPVYVNRVMYVGCGDGELRYLSETRHSDDETGATPVAIESYFVIKDYDAESKDKYKSLEGLTIEGDQSSGGVCSIYVGLDGGTMAATAIGTFTLDGTAENVWVPLSGKSDKWKRIDIKISYPADGVKCRLISVTPDVKVLGRTK